MTTISVRDVRDQHGASHSVVKQRCDGPECTNTIESSDALFAAWGSMLGFVDVSDDAGSANWCSIKCMKAWAAALVDPGPGDASDLERMHAEQHHYNLHSRHFDMTQCSQQECRAASRKIRR